MSSVSKYFTRMEMSSKSFFRCCIQTENFVDDHVKTFNVCRHIFQKANQILVTAVAFRKYASYVHIY